MQCMGENAAVLVCMTFQSVGACCTQERSKQNRPPDNVLDLYFVYGKVVGNLVDVPYVVGA